MVNGGYVMADASGLDVDSESTTVLAGLPEQLAIAVQHNKPCCFYGVVATSVSVPPVWGTVVDAGSGAFKIQLGSYSATVAANGTVTPDA